MPTETIAKGIDELRVADLRVQLESRSLETHGIKIELVTRLKNVNMPPPYLGLRVFIKIFVLTLGFAGQRHRSGKAQVLYFAKHAAASATGENQLPISGS